MKKLAVKLLLFSPLAIMVVSVNTTVDPARIFQSKVYERKLAEALNSGSAVTDLEEANFDDRTFQKFMIQSQKRRNTIAVFGSSRVMTISSDLFPGNTLLNNGLSASSLEDYIDLYEIYSEKKMLPSVIILGLDPWVFNKNNGLVGWRRFDPHYYSAFMGKDGRKGPFDLRIRPQDLIPYKYQQLISLSYFQAAVKYLDVHYSGRCKRFSLTNRKWNQNTTLLPDGSRTWRQEYREASLDEVRKQIRTYTDEARSIQGFFELDKGLESKFFQLIRTMTRDKVKVILYLPPYHPFAYDYYMHSSQYKIIHDVEIFLNDTSKAYGLPLVGSYDPRQLSIPESSFFDEIHLKDEGPLKKIFAPVSEELGAGAGKW